MSCLINGKLSISESARKDADEKFDEWITVGGKLKPLAGTAPNGVAMGTDSTLYTSQGNVAGGQFENKGANISHDGSVWSNDVVAGSDLTDGGGHVIDASGSKGGAFVPTAAVDGTLSTSWEVSTATAWWSWKEDSGSGTQLCNRIKLVSGAGYGNFPASITKIEGYDGADWTTIDSDTHVFDVPSSSGEISILDFTNAVAYESYKFTFATAVTGVHIGEIELYSTAPATVNNTVDAIMAEGFAQNWAPGQLKMYDGASAGIIDPNVEVDYDIGGGFVYGVGNEISLAAFRALDVDVFKNKTLKIRIKPLGSQPIARVELETRGADVHVSGVGILSQNVDGISMMEFDSSGTMIKGYVPSPRLVIESNIVPVSGSVYSLGTSAMPWKDLWLENSTLYIGETSVSTTSGGGLAVNGYPFVVMHPVTGELQSTVPTISGQPAPIQPVVGCSTTVEYVSGAGPHTLDSSIRTLVVEVTGASVVNVNLDTVTEFGHRVVIKKYGNGGGAVRIMPNSSETIDNVYNNSSNYLEIVDSLNAETIDAGDNIWYLM